MGWASGTDVMIGIIITIKKHISNSNTRRKIYSDVMDILDNQGWDDFKGCLDEDEAYDEIFNDMFPYYFTERDAPHQRNGER